jgi:hypothetical protein
VERNDTQHLDQLCALAHEAQVKAFAEIGATPDSRPFAELPETVREVYRAVVGAVLDGSAQHVAALLHGIGNELHRANHRASKIAEQLHETREWALEADAKVAELTPLLREAAAVLGKRGVLKLDLLSRLDAALADLPEAKP